jgi:hypothetical protein
MGLHDLPQHRLSHSRRMAGLAIPENGWSRDVAHDEQTGFTGAHSLGLLELRRVCRAGLGVVFAIKRLGVRCERV